MKRMSCLVDVGPFLISMMKRSIESELMPAPLFFLDERMVWHMSPGSVVLVGYVQRRVVMESVGDWWRIELVDVGYVIGADGGDSL